MTPSQEYSEIMAQHGCRRIDPDFNKPLPPNPVRDAKIARRMAELRTGSVVFRGDCRYFIPNPSAPCNTGSKS